VRRNTIRCREAEAGQAVNFATISGTLVELDQPVEVPSGIVVNFRLRSDSQRNLEKLIPCCAWDGLAKFVAELATGMRVVVVGCLDPWRQGLTLKATQVEVIEAHEQAESGDGPREAVR
jgi:hypothetical protein